MDVSIIISTFNYDKYIRECIESCLHQTNHNLEYEVIVIDDGSTDNTKEVVSKFTHNKNIQYYFQENSERSIARNYGIKNAKGDFVCFVDSDEKVHNDHLSKIKNGSNT